MSLSQTIPTEFTKLSSLPPELRSIIWQLAVPAQNRVIDCPSFRRIKSAPCPVLFLVCRESKFYAEKSYQRLRFCGRSCNLLMGDLVSLDSDGHQGLPISLDHDIFLIQKRKWWLWRTTVSNPMADAAASRAGRGKMTTACKRIEKFSALGVCRVCVTCRSCREYDSLVRSHCPECSDFREMIFYYNSRIARGRYNQDEIDWSWKWAHRVLEVFYQHRDWNEPRRMFPPDGPCECSLCQPWSRTDRELFALLKCAKPPSRDLNAHAALFKRRAGNRI